MQTLAEQIEKQVSSPTSRFVGYFLNTILKYGIFLLALFLTRWIININLIVRFIARCYTYCNFLLFHGIIMSIVSFSFPPCTELMSGH